jgi:HEPN domain-containing protein
MRRETEDWLRIAREEYQSAHILRRECLFRMVCYHAQQTVEKLLKAILSERQIDFSRTHNLLDLRNAVRTIGYDVDLTDEDAVFLGSVYRARYPGSFGLLPEGDPVEGDADKAIAIADRVLKFMETSFVDR